MTGLSVGCTLRRAPQLYLASLAVCSLSWAVRVRASDGASPSLSKWLADAMTKLSACRMKALLFHLVRTFEFEFAVPVESIKSRSAIVARPVIDGKNELPLLIRPVQ